MLSSKDQGVLSLLFASPAPVAPRGFVRSAAEAASAALEQVAIERAEAGQLQEAERLLSEAVEQHGAASALNNRAQVRQFAGKREAAEDDLRAAIATAEERGDDVTLRQAHCQLGMLLRLRCQDEEARGHFETAAKLGSSLAAQQAVLLNDTAKLCGDMVAMMFAELHRKNI